MREGWTDGRREEGKGGRREGRREGKQSARDEEVRVRENSY